eukprot:ANDGO_05626.mRNA.1 Epoxide hydrolase 1
MNRWIPFALGCVYAIPVCLVIVLRCIVSLGRCFSKKHRERIPSVATGFGTHSRVKLLNGMELHTVSVGKKGDPLVVLLHGFPESWYCWRFALDHFAKRQQPSAQDGGERGFYVVAVDMRGYGESDKPAGAENYMMHPFLLEDIKLLVDALGYTHISCLVGHDWGGAVSWNFAHAYPELVQKMMILNAPHPRLFMKNMTLHQAFVRSWYIFFIQLPYLPELLLTMDDYGFLSHIYKPISTCNEEDVEVAKYYTSKGLAPMLSWYRAIFLSAPDREMKAKLRKPIQCSVLVVWGEKDIALGKELLKGIGQVAPNSQIVWLPEVSHWVQQEAPEEVLSLLDHFLTQ